ncbi:MAG: LysR family transcriptional regulator [Clostridiales bacterium]|nr:LysR family transcriptional regulator [Clostridiales bacterium]
MELLQLRYFCRAAETQNFTKTAAEFLVPVSNISQTIRKLESELEVKLFDRHGNSVTLNKNGALFYSYISKAVASIEEARLALKERTGDMSGKINILALANRDVVSQCISLFHQLYPHVELTLETSLEKKGFHSFDLIVSGEDSRLNDYQKTLLLDDTFMIVVSSKSEYAHQHAMTKEQLEKEEFITLAKSISFNSALQRLGEQLGFTPAIMIVCEDPYYIIKYVEVGLGIAYIPSKTWKNRLSPGVKLLPVAGLSIQRQTYLYHNPRAAHSEASRHFVKMLINLSSGL